MKRKYSKKRDKEFNKMESFDAFVSMINELKSGGDVRILVRDKSMYMTNGKEERQLGTTYLYGMDGDTFCRAKIKNGMAYLLRIAEIGDKMIVSGNLNSGVEAFIFKAEDDRIEMYYKESGEKSEIKYPFRLDGYDLFTDEGYYDKTYEDDAKKLTQLYNLKKILREKVYAEGKTLVWDLLLDMPDGETVRLFDKAREREKAMKDEIA